jgi:hypothetical protein
VQTQDDDYCLGRELSRQAERRQIASEQVAIDDGQGGAHGPNQRDGVPPSINGADNIDRQLAPEQADKPLAKERKGLGDNRRQVVAYHGLSSARRSTGTVRA